MLDHVLVQGLHLALPPVQPGQPLQIGQLPPGEADHPGVMDPSRNTPLRAVDLVKLRQAEIRVAAIADQPHFRCDAAPAVQDVQAPKGPRKDALQLQGPVQHSLLAPNEQDARRAAV